jgi:hypothetical protein
MKFHYILFALVVSVLVMLVAVDAEAACWGCDQYGKCVTRESGTVGFTGCLAYTFGGNYFCDLSGSPCEGGGGGGPCGKPGGCTQGSLECTKVWRIASVTTWTPRTATKWRLSNVIVREAKTRAS